MPGALHIPKYRRNRLLLRIRRVEGILRPEQELAGQVRVKRCELPS
jgi:hypothetical protein